MTTNFTAIINANLDMFDTTETMSISEQVAEYNFFAELEREREEFEAQYEAYDEEIDKSLRSYIKELEAQASTMEEGSPEWMETMAVYSDVYKDIHGFRPYGIGLRFHGARA